MAPQRRCEMSMLQRSTIFTVLWTLFLICPVELDAFFALFWLVMLIVGLAMIVITPIRWTLK